MTRALTLAAAFALASTTAGAIPVPIGDGSELDFGFVPAGLSKSQSVFFSLGDTGRDESVNFITGPVISLISGPADVFSLGSFICAEIGTGIDCDATAAFAPPSPGNYAAEYEVSALINFTEIHPPDLGEVFEFSDSFQVTFRGTSVQPIPLPAPATGLLVSLGILGWVGRKRRAAA